MFTIYGNVVCNLVPTVSFQVTMILSISSVSWSYAIGATNLAGVYGCLLNYWSPCRFGFCHSFILYRFSCRIIDIVHDYFHFATFFFQIFFWGRNSALKVNAQLITSYFYLSQSKVCRFQDCMKQNVLEEIIARNQAGTKGEALRDWLVDQGKDLTIPTTVEEKTGHTYPMHAWSISHKINDIS